MRLRTRFTLLFGIAAVFGLVWLASVLTAVRDAKAASQAQEQVGEAMREARGLLALTLEVVLHGQPRAVEQWRIRHETLETLLRRAAAEDHAVDVPALDDEIAFMSRLFDRLQEARSDVDDRFQQRRVELITDNLLVETQSILDNVHRWGVEAGERRVASERRLAVLAVGGPAALLLSLLAVGWALSTRVLHPLDLLGRAMKQVERGDLTVRRGATSDDEIGDLARAFDRMTGSLEVSLRRLADNEQRLRTITDNLPARIWYADTQMRLRFVNAACADGRTDAADGMLGSPLREALGDTAYRRIEDGVAAALRGERAAAVVAEDDAGEVCHREYIFIPDKSGDGAVRGCYAMAHDISDHVQAQRRIEAALDEKEALLREVHHRVKNNMQVVSSLLALESRHAPSAEIAGVLSESRDRIKSMALIHEKLYQTQDFSRVDFSDYVRTLVDMLASTYQDRRGRIRVSIEADPVWLDIERAVPAGLALNELVSNSFKHAFPGDRQGQVAVSVRQVTQNEVLLAVRDDGVGLPPGLALESARTLGLRLIRILAGQLDGKATLSDHRGFRCEIRFPAAS